MIKFVFLLNTREREIYWWKFTSCSCYLLEVFERGNDDNFIDFESRILFLFLGEINLKPCNKIIKRDLINEFTTLSFYSKTH